MAASPGPIEATGIKAGPTKPVGSAGPWPNAAAADKPQRHKAQRYEPLSAKVDYPLPADRAFDAAVHESPVRFMKRNAGSPLANFDARAVWLAYVLLSTAVFMQRSWSGLALSGLLTAALIAAFRLPLRRWRGAILALGSFTILFSAIAGFGGEGGAWWGAEDFLRSLASLTPPFLAMLLGLGLPLAITPLRLRRSLEQTLSVRGKVPAPARTVILTVALLLRFVPVLLAEWERFSRIAVARGKITRFTVRGAIRRLRDIAIPFMLALFRLGEQVADALISRGVGFRKHPTLLRAERWRRRDSLLLAGSAALAVLLWWWEHGVSVRL